MPRRRLPRLPRENRRTWIAAIALVCVAIVVAAVAVHELTKQKAVYNSSVPFVATTTTPKVTKTPAAKFLWPYYGFTTTRTRVFDGPAGLKPPFTTAWKIGGNAPLEFPPDIDGNSLYYMDDHATVNRIDALTGKKLWHHQIGTWSAASPALDPKQNLLFVPVLSLTGETPGNGEFAALSMTSGKIVWKVPVPSGSESSPMISGDNVYFGDQAGTVYDLNTLTGKEIWTFQANGAEKGGPTLSHGILYFGTYGGSVYAISAKTGKQIWQTSVGGTVYASPTVADGRVYVGSTSGFFYSFSATTGTTGWSISTGNYVYSSAAVDDTPGLGPTVYFGSYTGTAYAVNAATGHVDWTADLGDSISGAASIVNNIVFFSGVYHSETRGYDIATGKLVYSFPDGAYTATVASPTAVYLSGHYVLYKLVPKA